MSNITSTNEDALLRALVEGTAGETGLPFFRALVQGLSYALGTHGAWITEYLPVQRRLRAIALRMGGEWIPHYARSWNTISGRSSGKAPRCTG